MQKVEWNRWEYKTSDGKRVQKVRHYAIDDNYMGENDIAEWEMYGFDL
tara:strand:- start:380 stop:523 length:144 start_codon:yes stop_codon:yes gene_type:complete